MASVYKTQFFCYNDSYEKNKECNNGGGFDCINRADCFRTARRRRSGCFKKSGEHLFGMHRHRVNG